VEFYRSSASQAQSQDDNRRMFARLSAFVIWSLVAMTAVFWVLRFAVRAPQAPSHAVAVDRSAPIRGDLARLFGAPLVAGAEVKAAAPSRYRLVGVMAPKSQTAEGSGAYGLALIAVDGKPARAYAVGSRLDSDLVLQSVGLRTASLGSSQGSRRVLLELPALPVAATGVLPVPGSGPAPVVRPVPAVAPFGAGAQPPPAAPGVQPPMSPGGMPPTVPNQ
jgi:general secretion pathway protein C